MAQRYFTQWLGQLYALMLSRPAVAQLSHRPASVSSRSSVSPMALGSVGSTSSPFLGVRGVQRGGGGGGGRDEQGSPAEKGVGHGQVRVG
jgi:hypothetical protein